MKLAEALAVGDVAVLAGIDMVLGGAASIPVASFARIPHDAVPAIREAVRDPTLSVPGTPVDVEDLAARTADAWRLWHTSREHRTDVGRVLPRLITDIRLAVRSAEGANRRSASAVLSDVYALAQHEIVWASEAELTWTVADRAMTAAQEADSPVALAGAAWTLGMVQRSAGDIDGARVTVIYRGSPSDEHGRYPQAHTHRHATGTSHVTQPVDAPDPVGHQVSSVGGQPVQLGYHSSRGVTRATSGYIRAVSASSCASLASNFPRRGTCRHPVHRPARHISHFLARCDQYAQQQRFPPTRSGPPPTAPRRQYRRPGDQFLDGGLVVGHLLPPAQPALLIHRGRVMSGSGARLRLRQPGSLRGQSTRARLPALRSAG